MKKARIVTNEEIYESIKDVCKSLSNVKNIVNAIDKHTKVLTSGISILQDNEPSLIKTRGFDTFYKNMLNCMRSNKLKESAAYLIMYVFDVEANRLELSSLIKDSIGLKTPITKRKIKNLSIINDKDKEKTYVKNIMELFDCYKEIITYDNYIMPVDKENKSKVIKIAIKVMDSIYTLLQDDMKLRFYSKTAYEELMKIVKIIENGNGKLINLNDEERLINELNENILFSNEDVDDLYGDLVLRFVKFYNDSIVVNNACSCSNDLIKKLKGKNAHEAKKKLDSVSRVMLKKVKQYKDNELFLVILEYLLDEEGKKAWEGDSYEYYCAINGLSMDCSSYMYDKGIYSDKDLALKKLSENRL